MTKTAQRLAIYSARFRNGVHRVPEARIVDHSTLGEVKARLRPRAPRPGEYAIRVRLDVNGVSQEVGDLLLGLKLGDQICDWEVTQARPVYRLGDSLYSTYRYMVVRPATAAESDAARALEQIKDGDT